MHNAEPEPTAVHVMKLTILLALLMLTACAENLVIGSNINGFSYQSDPGSVRDPRVNSPQFYMDKDDALPWVGDMPANNR